MCRMLLMNCLLLTVLATQATTQDYTQWGLPEDAKMRLGKGQISGNIAYSPDATRLAVASSIGIWLYDTATYQEVALLTGHTSYVISVVFSPDGKTLASRSGDDTVWLWDAVTGKHKHTLTGHTSNVRSVAFSSDRRTLASGSLDKTIRLWDVVTGKDKHTLTGHTSGINSVVFSLDGKTLASRSDDDTVRLWDTVTGEHKRTLTAVSSSIAFSPDGRTLASGSVDGVVHLWNVVTGEDAGTLTGHTHRVTSVAFSPDGRTLASGSYREIRLWDTVTSEHKHTLIRHTSYVISVVFGPDGQMLASRSDEGTELWDAVTGQHKQRLKGHTVAVSSVAFSPDGRTLASGSRDDTVRLWDAATGEHKGIIQHARVVSSVVFSPDGRTLASGSNDDNTIRLWDVVTGEHKRTFAGHGRAVAFRPDGEAIASGSGRTIRLWDVVTGEHKRTFTGHTSGVTSISFSPDGRTLASGSVDGVVHLWEAITGKHKQKFTGHTGRITSVAFSLNGRTLASGSYDNTVRVWDAGTGEHKETLTGHTRSVYSVAFSPDGKTLASASGKAIHLWDVATVEHKWTFTGGRTSDVSSVAFSPDGRTLASDVDNTIRLWDIVTGEQKRTLIGHASRVSSVAFSLDGRTLASGGYDGTVLLWEIIPSTNITVSVSPSSVPSPAIGEQLTLSLSIANGKNVAGYQATMHFNPTALRYVESANGGYLPAGAFFVPPVVETKYVTLGATALTGVSNGDGTLATLTFEVVDVKKSVLTLSEVILTDSDGEPLLPPFVKAGWIEPIALPSSAIVSVTPARVLSPAIGEQLVFNVDITDGQNVAEHQLTWEFDNTALRYISSGQGDYLAGGVGNGDGRLMTGTFEVLAVKASTVSVTGYLTASNGIRSIPTFESAEVVVPLFGDVNRDGAVNILDLILVASSFGQPVPAGGNPADVNEDGVVNIVDLVKVAGALGNVRAAPSAHPETLTILTTADVKQWLAQAQGLDLTDATLQRGIIFLERLLAALPPKETALLPNYPNPFNPETWIPYHLAHDADVRLTIYDTTGTVVRRLDLGHQPAGYYTPRTKAAYWDGRNSLGEVVGSGVYFYQLSVDDFPAMRKMVILK